MKTQEQLEREYNQLVAHGFDSPLHIKGDHWEHVDGRRNIEYIDFYADEGTIHIYTFHQTVKI